MMRQNSIDNQVGLTELLGNFAANFNVRAFHFMVDSLADIMQQASTFSQNNVNTDLSPRKPLHLPGWQPQQNGSGHSDHSWYDISGGPAA